MIHFKATNDQLRQLINNAINASSPVGLGLMHFKAGDISLDRDKFEDQLRSPNGNIISVDYFQGRMVKLTIWKNKDMDGSYRMRENIRGDYESWICKYPTVPDLLKSAGILEYEVIE